MPTPAVIERLRELHAELAETPDAFSPSVRPDAVAIKKQLDTIMLDPSQAHLYTSLNDRLLLAYIGFQIDHPNVAKAMQDAMAAMTAAGL